MERRFMPHIDDVESRLRGAAGSWRQCVMMDVRREMASMTGLARSMRQFYSEGGPIEDGGDGLYNVRACAFSARYEFVRPVCDLDLAVAWLGHPTIDVGLW